MGKPELITYTDLLWQLALQPNVSITPPGSEDLNIALQILINQRLIALEAERLPRSEPTDDEVKAKIQDVLANFPSTAEFERRLRIVGFDSVKLLNCRQSVKTVDKTFKILFNLIGSFRQTYLFSKSSRPLFR